MQEDSNPKSTLAYFIDQHNEYLQNAVDAFDREVNNPVCYLNLRGEVQDWSDELHPAEMEMTEIAEKFRSVIEVATEGECPAVRQVEPKCLQ